MRDEQARSYYLNCACGTDLFLEAEDPTRGTLYPSVVQMVCPGCGRHDYLKSKDDDQP